MSFNSRDPSDGLFSRTFFSEKLPVDLLHASLLSKELFVIMADIDDFKAINDTDVHLVCAKFGR